MKVGTWCLLESLRSGRVSEDLRTPRLLAWYQQYLDKQDTAAFMKRVSQSYGSGTLERLAQHGLREVRRAAVLALGFLGGYETNHTLGCALQDEDRTVRTLADSSIRFVWTRDGSDAQRQEINTIIRLNAARRYQEAIRRASALLEQCPAFAEAWNQRAAAHYALAHFAEAIRDCHEALEINPYHFVAATSMGRAYLELGNQISALESFRRALRLNCDLEGVRAQVVRLERIVEGQERQG
jgi:tetratricopeptide (TPR) repeat protein